MSDGRQLGDFRLVRLLGRGGMGEVWEAERSTGADLVAIKRIREGDEDALSLRKLRDEAAISQQLIHPNIVRTFEVGIDRASCFVVMERLHGVSLSQVLALPGELPLELVAALGTQLLAGLTYLQEGTDARGQPLALVHRDLKPSNLLLTREGQLKIIDFGIARSDQMDLTQTQTGFVRGTLAYVAPELLEHARPGFRSDVYASALLLQELLTGERVFQAASEAALLSSILWSPIPPARQRRPDLPPALDVVLARGYARDPTARYARAAELGNAWRGALSGVVPWSEAEVAAWLLEQSFPEDVPLHSEVMGTSSLAPRPGAAAGSIAMPMPAAKRRASLALGLGLLGVVAAGVGGAVLVHARSNPERTPVQPERTTPVQPERTTPVQPERSRGPDATATAPEPTPGKPEPTPDKPEPIPDKPEPTPAQPERSRGPPSHHALTAAAHAPKTKPATVTGFLTVESSASWAELKVNDKPVGETPLVQAVLPSGKLRLQARRADGRVQVRNVVIRPNAETRVLLSW